MPCFGHSNGAEIAGTEERSLSAFIRKARAAKSQCEQPRADSQQMEHSFKEETSEGSGTR